MQTISDRKTPSGGSTAVVESHLVRETTMRAIVQHAYGSSEVLELRDIDQPAIGADNVLVRVRAAAVNPADWAIMRGLPYIARPVYGLRKPKNGVRGTDVAGEVEGIRKHHLPLPDGAKAGVSKLAVLMAESPAQTAFAEEALTHLDTLYRGALRLTRDPDSAQDLVQEAYLRALRYQHSYQQGTNMKAWLFAIMRNLFWDRFKGSRKEDVSLDDVGEFVLYDKLKDEGARPEADVLDKLAASEVVKAVEQLPPLHREVVLLVDVEGFSYKDAAQTLGVPIGTVMSRLHRARQQLQKSLYDYAVESGIVHANGTREVPQE